jgi:hypothetical protein
VFFMAVIHPSIPEERNPGANKSPPTNRVTRFVYGRPAVLKFPSDMLGHSRLSIYRLCLLCHISLTRWYSGMLAQLLWIDSVGAKEREEIRRGSFAFLIKGHAASSSMEASSPAATSRAHKIEKEKKKVRAYEGVWRDREVLLVVGYDKRQPAHLLLLLLGWNRKEEEQLQSRKEKKKGSIIKI